MRIHVYTCIYAHIIRLCTVECGYAKRTLMNLFPNKKTGPDRLQSESAKVDVCFSVCVMCMCVYVCVRTYMSAYA